MIWRQFNFLDYNTRRAEVTAQPKCSVQNQMESAAATAMKGKIALIIHNTILTKGAHVSLRLCFCNPNLDYSR